MNYEKLQPLEQLRIFNGGKFGDTITILGGVHGDELVGVQIVNELIKEFRKTYRSFSSECEGTIQIAFGNPVAIQKCKRSASEGRDLNRSFIREELEAKSSEADRHDLQRARELSTFLLDTDILIDLHSTSSPSEPFMCSSHLVSLEHKNFFKYFPADKILLDPQNNILANHKSFDGIGTTDYYVNTFSRGFALCYETGYEKDMQKKNEVFLLVLNIFLDQKFISPDYFDYLIVAFDLIEERANNNFQKNNNQKFFEIDDFVTAESTEFIFEEGMNKNWQYLSEGTKIGRYITGEYVKMPMDGYLLFPKAVHKIKIGHSIFYVANEI